MTLARQTPQRATLFAAPVLPGLFYTAFGFVFFCSMEFGLQLGILNPTMDPILRTWGKAPTDSSALIVSMLCGAVAGSMGGGRLLDVMGPRTALMWTALPLAAGCALAALSQTWGMLLAGRVVAGLGAGLISVGTPRYIAEAAPSNLRGILGCLNQIAVNTGILGSILMGLPYAFGVDSIPLHRRRGPSPGDRETVWVPVWRVLLGVLALLPLLQVLLARWAPESPVWHEAGGRASEALLNRRLLWGDTAAAAAGGGLVARRRARAGRRAVGAAGGTGDGGTPELEQGLLQHHKDEEDASGHAASSGHGHHKHRLARQLSSDSASVSVGGPPGAAPTLWAALAEHKRVVGIAVALTALQQLSAINVIIFYSSSIFAACGMRSPIVSSVTLGVVNIAGTAASAAIVSRTGKRALMVLSAGGMGASLALMALAGMLGLQTTVIGALLLSPLTLSLAFVVFFALGLGPFPWVLAAEILPSEVKGPALGLCAGINWGLNIGVSGGFPLLSAAIGSSATWAFYAAVNGLGALFLSFYCPETEGLTLDQIRHHMVLKLSNGPGGAYRRSRRIPLPMDAGGDFQWGEAGRVDLGGNSWDDAATPIFLGGPIQEGQSEEFQTPGQGSDQGSIGPYFTPGGVEDHRQVRHPSDPDHHGLHLMDSYGYYADAKESTGDDEGDEG